jgi:hypothetical protein
MKAWIVCARADIDAPRWLERAGMITMKEKPEDIDSILQLESDMREIFRKEVTHLDAHYFRFPLCFKELLTRCEGNAFFNLRDILNRFGGKPGPVC